MKRELDLLREILLETEEKLRFGDVMEASEYSLSDPESLRYHLELLVKEQFLDGYIPEPVAKGEIHSVTISGITWNGHDFLDQIREPDVWDKLKPFMQKHGIECVLTAIKTVVQLGVKTIFLSNQGGS